MAPESIAFWLAWRHSDALPFIDRRLADVFALGASCVVSLTGREHALFCSPQDEAAFCAALNVILDSEPGLMPDAALEFAIAHRLARVEGGSLGAELLSLGVPSVLTALLVRMLDADPARRPTMLGVVCSDLGFAYVRALRLRQDAETEQELQRSIAAARAASLRAAATSGRQDGGSIRGQGPRNPAPPPRPPPPTSSRHAKLGAASQAQATAVSSATRRDAAEPDDAGAGAVTVSPGAQALADVMRLVLTAADLQAAGTGRADVDAVIRCFGEALSGRAGTRVQRSLKQPLALHAEDSAKHVLRQEHARGGGGGFGPPSDSRIGMAVGLPARPAQAMVAPRSVGALSSAQREGSRPEGSAAALGGGAACRRIFPFVSLPLPPESAPLRRADPPSPPPLATPHRDAPTHLSPEVLSAVRASLLRRRLRELEAASAGPTPGHLLSAGPPAATVAPPRVPLRSVPVHAATAAKAPAPMWRRAGAKPTDPSVAIAGSTIGTLALDRGTILGQLLQ